MKDEFKSYCREGAHPSIVINNADRLTITQFREVLIRLRDKIEAKAALISEDSNYIGDKYTHCTWGICTNERDIYPTPELHTFPQAFKFENRIEPLDTPEGHDCPIRERLPSDSETTSMSGCFYSCRIFQKDKKTPTKEEAITLYEKVIENLEDRLCKQETAQQ